MTGFHLYTGNRLETLLEALAEVLQKNPPQPLDPTLILVQSKGMESWLSLNLARRFGIWANFAFPFPNALIDALLTAALGEEPEKDPFDRDRMTLSLLDLLPQLATQPRFDSLKHFLTGEAPDLKTYQLARRLAHLFDQYSIYRPDLLLSWERGEETDWQAELWRQWVAANPAPHRARRQREFLRRCQTGHLPSGVFPAALNIFGVSALPPYHIEVLAAAARFCPVHLFLLNPCQEFWLDLSSPKTAARREASAPEAFEALHYEVSQPLLASWGRSGRDFFGLLWEQGELSQFDLFQEPGENTLLAALQGDLLHLHDRTIQSEKTAVAAGDRSLQIHSCHSPLREIEALHDFLLGCFQDLHGLTPGDILVMAPDIGTYAPYIAAVFKTPSVPGRRLPFSVADLGVRRENRLASLFLELLALRNSRCGAPQVFDLLEAPPIMSRFGCQHQDLDRIRVWVEETRVRWGLDAADRARFGIPPFQENSWGAALDRLLLGHALPDAGGLFEGILPYDAGEGENAAILGRLADFIAAVAEHMEALRLPRSMRDWGEQFLWILERFFQPDEGSEADYLFLEELFSSLAATSGSSGAAAAVPIEVAEAYLGDRLESQAAAPGRFLSGAITFASLLPMRSIPFKIIALIGLNDDAFPRAFSAPAFDRIAARPQRGDRIPRHEDRYLFLETLLSARQRLFISYVGQSQRDNSELPPSVLVSELSDYLEKGFQGARSAIFFQHRLQAFHSGYFSASSPLASFSPENYQAALAARRGPTPPISDATRLPEADPSWKTIDYSDLIRFFCQPGRYFAHRRLGIVFRQVPFLAEEREPFALAPLDRYRLGERLTEAALAGKQLFPLYSEIREEGMLPPGAAGHIVFTDLALEAERLAQAIHAVAGEERHQDPPLALRIGEFQIRGLLPHRHGDRMVHHHFARLRAVDRLQAWLTRLLLDALEQPAAQAGSWLFARDGTCRLAPAPNPFPFLERLLALYWEGLHRPLPFFPETSLGFAATLARHPENRDRAREAGRKAWEGTPYQRGEKEDPSLRFCFGETDPLDADFEAKAEEIYAPLLNSLEKIP
ncbi:MAG: exodeoxyribonuclease V subunit gamma [Deltaproteobacteria bacterium]|nr:exodeoxyribonuclease V subunit gamma [Deltaproteobacteria bacterium]